jgi:hypothetical protein
MAILEAVYSRPDMIRALVSHFRLRGNPVILNVKLADFQFDVLAFDQSERTFMAVECMYGGQPKTLAEFLAKAASHFAVAKKGVVQFYSLPDKGMSNKNTAWPSAAKLKPGVRFSVSVALMEKVCKRVELLRALKEQFPAVGLLRVKMNGQCREYMRDRNGNKDFALAASTSVRIRVRG